MNLATLRDVYEGLRSDPGRFLLSLGAISIGMLALIVLVGVLDGLQKQSAVLIQSLGVNVIGIIDETPDRGKGRRPLEMKYAEILRRNLPDAEISTVRGYDVQALGSIEQVKLVTTDDALAKVRQWRLDDGRFISPLDLKNRERMAVISRTLGDTWNWQVGSIIMLGQLTFRIIGIIDTGGSGLDGELEDTRHILGGKVVFVPNTLQPYWTQKTNRPRERIDGLFIKTRDQSAYDSALVLSRRVLDDPHLRSQSIAWITPDTLVRGIRRLKNTLSVTLGGIAVLSILLGSTTLIGLMVSNVRERRAEIGLRRAMGASHWDIQKLFLLEAITIAVSASVVGFLASYLVFLFGRNMLPVPVQLEPGYFLIPLFVALTVGLLASVWPARIASRIEPSQALRD